MSVVAYDGRYLCSDTIGVTDIGMVSATQKSMCCGYKLYVSFTGHVAPARYLVSLILERSFIHHARMEDKPYANQVFTVIEGETTEEVEVYDHCDVRFVDAEKNNVWYVDRIGKKVVLIGEPAQPFVMGGETSKLIGTFMMNKEGNSAREVVKALYGVSNSDTVASRFVAYPLNLIDTETGEEIVIPHPTSEDEEELADKIE